MLQIFVEKSRLRKGCIVFQYPLFIKIRLKMHMHARLILLFTVLCTSVSRFISKCFVTLRHCNTMAPWYQSFFIDYIYFPCNHRKVMCCSTFDISSWGSHGGRRLLWISDRNDKCRWDWLINWLLKVQLTITIISGLTEKQDKTYIHYTQYFKLISKSIIKYHNIIKLGDAGTMDSFGLAFQYQI
jgi:hypothetical protein